MDYRSIRTIQKLAMPSILLMAVGTGCRLIGGGGFSALEYQILSSLSSGGAEGGGGGGDNLLPGGGGTLSLGGGSGGDSSLGGGGDGIVLPPIQTIHNPEPTTIALVGMGLAGLAFARRKSKTLSS